MSEQFGRWMTAISAPLLGATLVALLAMGGYVALLAGGFLREALGRGRQRRALTEAGRAAHAGEANVDRVVAALAAEPSGLPARCTAALRRFGVHEADRVVLALRHDVRAALARHSFLTRVAPMGGLVATLLPLGPALAALADGAFDEMARELTLAFTATVLGLVVSCLAYGMGVARRSWYARDMDEIESILLRVAPEDAA